MESGSVLSEPVNIRSYNYTNGNNHINSNNKGFFEKNKSMTILSHSTTKLGPKKMSQLESLEAKMANIEVSLSSTSVQRRKKGLSLGNISVRSSPKSDQKESPSKELRTALQDREAVIQNLRMQLGLAKLPRPTGPAFTEIERPAAEKRLKQLLSEADNKKVAIRNLKSALEKLDITDNIDVRIRQAELEYALGREELQLLSIIEEIRALQARLDKSKPEANTIFNTLESGTNLILVAVRATAGRWNAKFQQDQGFWVDWTLEGEDLCAGDRILEINGNVLSGKSREEFQKLINSNEKCEIVVLRKKPVAITHQQIQQYQADNLRLQHRISYLEEQVNELQSVKENVKNHENSSNLSNHSNSNSHITSISITSPPSTPPDDKPQIFQRGSYVTILDTKSNPPTPTKSHVTTTLIKEVGKLSKSRNSKHLPRTISASALSVHTDAEMRHKREMKRLEREKYNQQYLSQSTNHINGLHAQHIEFINSHHSNSEKRRVNLDHEKTRADMRSVRSLDFESDIDKNVDYTSEPVAARIRPVPPKKPLRLSLHRAQSLQTVEGVIADLEKPRILKRPHRAESTQSFIKTNGLLHTSSLGRQRYV